MPFLLTYHAEFVDLNEMNKYEYSYEQWKIISNYNNEINAIVSSNNIKKDIYKNFSSNIMVTTYGVLDSQEKAQNIYSDIVRVRESTGYKDLAISTSAEIGIRKFVVNIRSYPENFPEGVELIEEIKNSIYDLTSNTIIQTLASRIYE